MANPRHPGINDLTTHGHELHEEHLRLAVGGRSSARSSLRSYDKTGRYIGEDSCTERG